MENPIKMDDLGVPLFLETPIYKYVAFWGGKYHFEPYRTRIELVSNKQQAALF